MEMDSGLCCGLPDVYITAKIARIPSPGTQKEGFLLMRMQKRKFLKSWRRSIFSGGDPLYPDTRKDLWKLIQEIKNKYPKKTIWLYTGYLWEEICHLELISSLDVIVDGRFVEELKDNNLPWKGSSNQRVIDVQTTLSLGKTVLYS